MLRLCAGEVASNGTPRTPATFLKWCVGGYCPGYTTDFRLVASLGTGPCEGLVSRLTSWLPVNNLLAPKVLLVAKKNEKPNFILPQCHEVSVHLWSHISC